MLRLSLHRHNDNIAFGNKNKYYQITKKNSIMKKFALSLVIVSMVVLDLVLSGMNVVAGVLLIAGAGLFCAAMDYAGSKQQHTTSITHAARQNRKERLTSRRESSCVRPSWDGWQRYSQELRYAK